MTTSPQPQLSPAPPVPDVPVLDVPVLGSPEPRGPVWVFLGPHGLRAGWSILLAYCIFYFFRLVAGTVFFAFGLVGDHADYAPAAMAALEAIPFLAMLGTGALIALLEHRHMLDFNLRGARPAFHFASGLCAGLLVLSALIGMLRAGGWLRFGPPALSGMEILRYAALWGVAYLLVGCVEEGLFRCYLQFTLTRGISFWWALPAQAGLCLYTFFNARGGAALGVYAFAAAGFFPCLLLHQKSAARNAAFWQAAWVSSTFFGMVHTFNGGENWIGILAASCIGLVFCVSIRITGSAWWAIGCHTAWDWAETYIYGTADSGLPAQGHLLSTSPAGNPLLSGGTDGPEGSLLALAAIVLLLAFVLITHGGRKAAPTGQPTAQA